MTQKYSMVAFFIVGLVVVNVYLSLYEPLSHVSFLVEATSGNAIDIADINSFHYAFLSEKGKNQVFFTKNRSEKQVFYMNKPLTSIALSPSKQYIAFFYRTSEETTEDVSLTTLDIENHQFKEVYHTSSASWDVRGSLHWLNNNYIFFLRHCGTECQGITLLNLESGQTTNAVVSNPPFPDMPATTHFKDWFGQEFVINGLLDDVTSETVNNHSYLIFTMKDYEENSLGKKRFVFVNNRLETVDEAKIHLFTLYIPATIHKKIVM